MRVRGTSRSLGFGADTEIPDPTSPGMFAAIGVVLAVPPGAARPRRLGNHGRMPPLVPPILPTGTLGGIRQPRLAADDGTIALRPWRVDDAGAVRAAFDCPQIQRWHLRRMDGDAEARDWTAQWPARWAAESDASWAVVEPSSDRPLGQVGLRDIRFDQASAEVSYWVLPAARGDGLAGRAVRLLQAWAFDRLGLHRLDLRHSAVNSASCRVAGKLGYPVEGTLRGAWWHADGWHDVHLHARLRDDGDRAAASGPTG
ncbi:GNAT family N-acetyltransferase [Plantactinospora endophytica]|uniref:N-acetyltransferase domain-containing protein n=1 Tax=Plantactinospora endophytica TaxID=673535 RepID=A0ABQ4EDV1_9ACTN|nr:GNAT family N-acetyltransferase [Plantactinospora endophytica]GIG92864.1 hypothetical protein Pen02_78000 [Plantactinospora endophytica]